LKHRIASKSFQFQLPIISKMQRVTVLKRPSASIKSPYVADIQLDDGTVAMCHTPGLGCCGLVEAGRVIYVKPAASKTAKTAWTAVLAECTDETGVYTVGIHPMISQKAAAHVLDRLGYVGVIWKSEVVINEHTRLDYVGTLPTGKKVYVEVKNAMVSGMTSIPRASRRALFPDGFRKKKDEPVSPRAVKHAETLAELALRPDTEAAILLYTVPRDDCGDGLEINPRDPIYCRAVWAAVRAGVKIWGFSFTHTPGNEMVYEKSVPVYVPRV
jgi:DNA-binding sugar fermentation-stimulating protein